MEVQLRFDANQMRAEFNKVLSHKIRAVKSGYDEPGGMYEQLLESFYEEIVHPQLYKVEPDTFAFAEADSGKSEKTGYKRHGTKTITSHHGIERDAIEDRPSGPVSYFGVVAARITGDPSPSGQSFWDSSSDALKLNFLKEAKSLITREMNNG